MILFSFCQINEWISHHLSELVKSNSGLHKLSLDNRSSFFFFFFLNMDLIIAGLFDKW